MFPRHVYVHVPFCARRCTYCDFAIAVRRTPPVDEYLTALARELEHRFPERAPWSVETIYLGGGTPSQLGGDGVSRLLDILCRRIAPAPEAEVTLEANPDDVTPNTVRAWRAAGVNRLSIGAQSFDDRVLAWMHRTHTAARIAQAVDHARGAGIANLSLDLIFALPASLERDWEHDVQQALALTPEHLSVYGLTVEPNTALAHWRDRGAVAEAPEEQYEREFLAAHAMLTGAGFEHYEVSSYARPGQRSRHNASYWRHVPYVGLGPAAHSFDGRERRWNRSAYADWVRAAGAGRDPVAGQEVLTPEELGAERMYLGLRRLEGVELPVSVVPRVSSWVEAGWATLEGTRLALTPLGWLRLDALAADLTLIGSR